MDAVVQLLRNALCTAKNFNFLGDTFLYDSKVISRHYAAPEPFDQTTPLELLISFTQFYVVVTATLGGFKLVTGMMGKLKLLNRLVNLQAAAKKFDADKKKKDDDDGNGKVDAVARKLVTKSILDESDSAARLVIVGANLLVIGPAFFWLFAHSFHVTGTDLIGGIWGLIHALSAMEVCLIVFLYYMAKDAGNAIRRSYRMKKFADEIATKGKVSDVESVTAEQYGWLVGGWSPFWASGKSDDAAAEGKMLTKEEEAVASNLTKFAKKVDADVAVAIQAKAGMSLFEGYREYVYMFLNFCAFYGYLVGILAFYYQDEEKQPEYIRAMLFWMPNDSVSWIGNAVGDLAWTMEPVIILTSPVIMNSLAPMEKKKEKVA